MNASVAVKIINILERLRKHNCVYIIDLETYTNAKENPVKMNLYLNSEPEKEWKEICEEFLKIGEECSTYFIKFTKIQKQKFSARGVKLNENVSYFPIETMVYGYLVSEERLILNLTYKNNLSPVGLVVVNERGAKILNIKNSESLEIIPKPLGTFFNDEVSRNFKVIDIQVRERLL